MAKRKERLKQVGREELKTWVIVIAIAAVYLLAKAYFGGGQ